MNPSPYYGWAFAWIDTKPRPFITNIVAYTKRECIREVEKLFGEPWKKTLKSGGRCVKVIVQIRPR